MEKGRKIRGVIWLAVLLCLCCALPALAEEEAPAGKTIIGYFAENKTIRPRPESSTEYLGTVAAYTVMEMEDAGNNWGIYTSPGGITGYIYCEEIRSLPEPEPCPERPVYVENRQMLRSLPEAGQQDPRRVGGRELLTVDGICGDFAHVRTTDGEAGYVLARLLMEAVFEPAPIEPVRFCAGREAGALALPLKGAEELMTVYPGTVYEASQAQGEYYVLRSEDGRPAYVWRGDVRLWLPVSPEATAFFRAAGVSTARGDEAPENVYAQALVRRDTVMYCGDGREEKLGPEDRVYVYVSYGGFCGVSRGQVFGYVAREDLEIRNRSAMAAAIAEMDLSGAAIERNEFLDQAFTFLEEGNSILLRYNAITGADVQPLFPLGVPYFWGGRGYNVLTERYPEYTTRAAWQDSINYYHKGTIYLYGFDCTGLVKNVYRMAGHTIQGTVSDLGLDAVCRAGHHVWCSADHPMPEDWNEVARGLEIGDLLWVKHPGTHNMIYIGTLRDYGYTEEQLPAMAGMLDYPLMIHCSRNPYCYFRFKNLLDSQTGGRLGAATPPDGGVSLCILGPEREEAEMQIEYLDGTDSCFDVEGTCIRVFSFREVTRYFFYRDTLPAPEEEEGAEQEALPEEAADAMERVSQYGDE